MQTYGRYTYPERGIRYLCPEKKTTGRFLLRLELIDSRALHTYDSGFTETPSHPRASSQHQAKAYLAQSRTLNRLQWHPRSFNQRKYCLDLDIRPTSITAALVPPEPVAPPATTPRPEALP